MSDLGTTAFDNSEKIDILIKENFNVSSTNENTPWYLESNATFNTYVNGKDILLDDIPNTIDWASSSFLTASELSSIYGLTSSNFYSGGGVKKDSTGVLHKFIKLKLQPIPGTSITSGSTTTYFSYYHKNSNGINLLENSFQLNHGDGSSFAYSMYSNAGIASNVSILQDSNGGNWFFNFKNGIIFVPDPTKNSTMLSNVNQNNLPYFTFVKYVGRKGVAKQISVVQNKTSISNPENNQIAVQISDNTLHRYDTSLSTPGWISIGGGGGSTTITQLSEVGDVTYPTGGITNGYVLKWNGSSWIPSPDLQGTGGGGGTSGILNSFTESQVLEKIKAFINGNHITVSSGNQLSLSSSTTNTIPYSNSDHATSWEKINIFNGEEGFKPPVGTKQVNLKYTAFLSFGENVEISDKDALLEWAWDISGVTITNSKSMVHLDLIEKYASIETTIFIDSSFTDDLSNNKLGTWDSKKSIQICARSKDTNRLVQINKKTPNIEITSIGQGSSIANLNDIPDVSFNVNNLRNEDILKWDATNNKWINGNAPSTFSGSYNDLLHKPSIPTGNQVIDWTASGAGTIDSTNYVNTTYSIGDEGRTEKNFTTVLNNKLDGIEEGAEVNVQADWNVADTSSDAFIKNKPTNLSEFTNNSGFITKSNVDTLIANLVNDAPEHLDTLRELADAIRDTSDNKIVALTRSISEKQNRLTAGPNITIDGNIISAEVGTTINSLNDISNVDVGDNLRAGQVLKWNGSSWTAQNDNTGNGDGNGNGNGVSLVPTAAQQSDLSGNRPYPNGHSGTGTEGDIIYDVSKNKFYEASNSKDDNTGIGIVEFRPLGYSFFAENMEGQPPNVQSTSFFFFELTPSSIVLHWRNPFQYETGITASTSQSLNENAPIVSQPSGGVGGKINFPVVNRIMMQIKKLSNGEYISWGTKRSPISQNVTGLTGGYVICSKHYPIPPMTTNRSFGDNLSDGGRSTSVYKLNDFAESIILYSAGNTPTNGTIKSGISSYPKRIFPVSGETNKELISSDNGYEIKFWYENEYKVNPNSTLADGWGMTENDFNVVTLNQARDQNGNLILDNGKINFLSVQPPTAPLDCSCSIVFNNLGNVSNASTIVQIKVKDPENTTATGSQYNTTINLTQIKFEYRNNASSGTTGGWNIIKKLFDKDASSTSNNTSIANKGEQGSKVTLSSGVYSINRKRDDNYRYFYVEVNNDMLGVTNYAVEKYLSFRVSYKNASIDNFGTTKVTNELIFDKPNKPIIRLVKMTNYNTFTITLASFSDTEDIIGDTTNISNNNMGVFLRKINFNVTYKYSDEDSQTDISTFTGINGGESSQTTSTSTPVYINTTSFGSSTYTYTLPAGFFPSGSTNTNPITYYFGARVQNNLISDYSIVSEQKSIQITKPNQTSDSINFTILDSTSNKNNTLSVSWSHPTYGERGIVSSQSSTGLPKIQKYTFKSSYLKDNDDNRTVDHGVTDINSASNRNSDPSTTKEFTFYDALKYDGSNLTKTIDGGLDIEIKEYNEYVNDNSTFSSSISATATKPSEATNLRNDTINILTSTTKNNTKILWTAPSTSQRGLTIENAARDNTIIKYDISINRITTNKYLLGKNAQSTPSFTTTNYTTTITNEDNTSDKTSTTDPTTSLSLVKTLGGNNMFLWPDSTYTFEVKTTNSLGYQTTGVNNNFITPAPSIPSELNYFDKTRLATLTTGKTTNLSNHSHYSNKGVLVTTDITTNTSYSGTPVQITKLFSTSKPTNITSNPVHHLLNKTSFQDISWNNSNATVVSWTDSNPPSSSNQSQFKIWNIAPSTDVNVYTIGTSSNFLDISGVNKDSIGIKFDITRDDREDGYKYNSNYDSRNYGYWYSERVKYTITFTTGSVRVADLYTPLKYELRSYYNTNGGGNVSNSNNGSTVILQNTNNTNGYIYFDDSCTANPSIIKNNGNNYITYTINNYINGVPNIYPLNSIYNKLSLTYRVDNYSTHYLLDGSLNLFYYTISNTNTNSSLGHKKWSDFGNSAPSGIFTRNNNHWITSNHEFDFISRSSSSRADLQLTINANNTKGNGTHPVEDGVCKFIYDKESVDLINELKEATEAAHSTSSGSSSTQNGQIMDVPSNFNPHELSSGTTQGSDFNDTVFNQFSSNYNSKQLILFNGKFSTPKYLYDSNRTFYNALQDNKTSYNITKTFKTNTDTTYSWVIYKFRREYTENSPQYLNWFVLSFNENSNITSTHLENGDAQIWIQTKLTTNGSSYTTHTYTPNPADGVPESADGEPGSLKWINYKPSGANTTQSVDATLGAGADLGANNDSSSFDKTGNVGASGINIGGTTYSSKKRNLVGVINNVSKISSSGNIIYYIAVGLKNNKSLWVSKPASFDAFLPDKNISR